MQRLFDIKKTQINMLKARGYKIPEIEENLLKPETTLFDFTRTINALAQQHNMQFRPSLSRAYHHSTITVNGQAKIIYVFYGGKTDPQQKQVPADVVRKLINDLETYNISDAILIVDAPLSTISSKELLTVKMKTIQVFHEEDLAYDPSEHILTSKHTLVPEDEKYQKLRELKTKLTQVELLGTNDVIVKYYGWKVGDLIRVDRDDSIISVLGNKSVNYRVVTDSILK